jgi:hypothetical protein
VVELAGQLAHFLDEAREIRERRPVAILELADPGIDGPLGFFEGHDALPPVGPGGT